MHLKERLPENHTERLDKEQWLKRLAYRYEQQKIILDGTTQIGSARNRVLFSSLRNISTEIDSTTTLGIHILGSRIKGYSTLDSDLDFATVGTNENDITSLMNDHLAKHGFSIEANRAAEVLMELREPSGFIPATTDTFLEKVNKRPHSFQKLFGTEIIATSNLYLGQLAFVEALAATGQNAEWDSIQKVHAVTCLGQPHHDIPKIAKRIEVPESVVSKHLPEELFKYRYEAFGLKSFNDTRASLRKWIKENDPEVLKKYSMYPIVQNIMKS